MRPKISVVFATYNRGHLLRRSIVSYNKSEFPLSQLEVVVVDDASTDDTAEAVKLFDSRINLVYIRLRKEPGLWRDCAAVLNVGIRACAGEFVIITHPEVCLGRQTLQGCLDAHAEGLTMAPGKAVWVMCKPYYMSPRDMTHLDAVKFDERGPLAVNDIPGFRDPTPPGGFEGFHPDAIDKLQTFGNWVLGGTDRPTWRQMGGLVETQRWGSVDIMLMGSRYMFSMATATPTSKDAIVVHLNHDDEKAGQTPRIEHGPGGWREEIDELHLTPEKCRYPGNDHLW